MEAAIETAVMNAADIHFVKHSERASADYVSHRSGKGRPSRLALGAFPGSFNPVTTAHVELIRRAGQQFSLDEIVLLAGPSNADKSRYECDLEDRLRMLMLALEEVPKTSIAVCKPAFFVDMIDGLHAAYSAYSSGIEVHFIMGKDTLMRILDPDGRYLDRYRKRFATAPEALDYLLTMSRLIVAERAYPDSSSTEQSSEEQPQKQTERIVSLDFPLDLAEQSATQVREALRTGRDISGLVPPRVETYIRQHSLYLPSSL
ncbi:MAG TPA: nicotinate-nicotinamide nucleotide adenylyltransferase [Blastocatellia bacterium]